jgi:hypothetical protein
MGNDGAGPVAKAITMLPVACDRGAVIEGVDKGGQGLGGDASAAAEADRTQLTATEQPVEGGAADAEGVGPLRPGCRAT